MSDDNWSPPSLVSQFCLFSVDIVVGGGHEAPASEIGTTQELSELSRQTRNWRDTGHAHTEQEHTATIQKMLPLYFHLDLFTLTGWQSGVLSAR